MNEPKTFDELSLRDKIYSLTDAGTFISRNIFSIKTDDQQINKTLISIDSPDEEVSFPDGEHFYDDRDREIKYTTDPKVYAEWKKPSILREIAEKEKRIESIKFDIEELRKSIA